MGNRPSLAFRKKQGLAAKFPDTSSSLAQLDAIPPLTSARRPEPPQQSSREDSARDDILTPRSVQASDADVDPLEFFQNAQAFAESGSSDHASLLYSQAMCLQVTQEFAAASALYRELIARESVMALEAHFHLAQCILMHQSDALPNDALREAQVSLEHVIQATTGVKKDSDDVHVERMRLESTELLAHLLTSQSRFRESLALYDSLPNPSPIVVYERAFCHHTLCTQDEEDAAAVAAEHLVPCGDLTLMQVDAQSICRESETFTSGSACSIRLS